MKKSLLLVTLLTLFAARAEAVASPDHIGYGALSCAANGVTTIDCGTFTMGAGFNRALVCTIAWSGTVTSPTLVWDQGGTNQSMTVVTGASATNTVNVQLWGLVAPTAGLKTLRASWTTSRDVIVHCTGFVGVNQTGGATSFASGTNATGNTAVPGVAITSTVGSVTVAGYAIAGSATIDLVTTQQTFINNTGATNVRAAGSRSLAPGAALVGLGASLSSVQQWAAVGAKVVAATQNLCPAANLNLGYGWTRVDCGVNAGGATNPTNQGLVWSQGTNLHDTIVVFCDTSANDRTVGAMLVSSVTDNAGNTFQRVPSLAQMLTEPNTYDTQAGANTTFPTLPAILFTSPPAAAMDLSFWIAFDNQTAMAPAGYVATCTAVSFGGATLKDVDMSIMVFRHSTGQRSRGAVNVAQWQNDRQSAAGTCPCVSFAPMVVNAAYPGALIIASGNMNGGPVNASYPFVGCDGTNTLPAFAAYYAFCTTVPPNADVANTSLSFTWYDSDASDHYAYGAIAILPPDAAFPRTMMGVGR